MRKISPVLMAIAAAMLALSAAPAAAAPFQSIAGLQNRVVAVLGAGVGEPGGPATPIDPRLKLAPCPTAVTIDPPAMGAVALRCPAAGWRVRVPLARLVGRGAAAAIEPVVRRGDPVDLVAETGGFSVSVAATAQEDGAPGARIRVRADGDGHAQGQILFAQVIEAGRVRLPGFN